MLATGGGTGPNQISDVCRSGFRMISVYPHNVEEDDQGNRVVEDASKFADRYAQAVSQAVPAGYRKSIQRPRVISQRLSSQGAVGTARNICRDAMIDSLSGSMQTSLRKRSDGSYSCCGITGTASSSEGAPFFVMEQTYQAQ